MIAAYVVIFALSLVLGLRGEQFSGLIRRMGWKILILALIVSAIALSAVPAMEVLIATPVTILLLGIIGASGLFIGRLLRGSRR